MGGSVKNPFEKIKHFCAYQERSHFETKQKLYLFGLSTSDVEALLAKLIEENYLNEERFAQCFARGRFALKKWGRVKIKHELALKKVSATNIKTSLKEIDEDDYQQTLQHLAEKKWLLLSDEQPVSRQAKTIQYLLQKGYELPLIQNVLKAITARG
jgi:regulatory protein